MTDPIVLTTEQAVARGPQPGEAYVVISGLSPEEKARVLSVVRQTNERLASDRGKS